MSEDQKCRTVNTRQKLKLLDSDSGIKVLKIDSKPRLTAKPGPRWGPPFMKEAETNKRQLQNPEQILAKAHSKPEAQGRHQGHRPLRHQ